MSNNEIVNTIAVTSSIFAAIENNARIINLGFGFDTYESPQIDAAIMAAYNAGIVIFAPVGEGSSWNTNVDWPARNLLMTFSHHLFLNILDVFSFNEFWQTLLRVILSTLFTFLFIMLFEYIFAPRKEKK